MLETAYARGELRLKQCAIDETVADEDIVGYEDCVKAYDLMADRQRAAHGDLLAIMMSPAAIVQSAGEGVLQRQAWRYRELPFEDGRKLALAYKIEAYEKDELITVKPGDRYGGKPALQVWTYTVHKPMHDYTGHEARLSGDMTGRVIFPADAAHAKLFLEEVRIAGFDNLKTTVQEALQQSGRAAALEPLIADFMAVAGDRDEASGNTGRNPLGLTDSRIGERVLGQLLLRYPKDEDTAMKLLAEAFQPQHFNAFYTLLERPIARLNDDLDQYGIRDKYAWLMANLTSIRTAVRDAVRHAVTFEFRDNFMARVDKEQEKVTVVQDLADAFHRETVDMTDCAPVTPAGS